MFSPSRSQARQFLFDTWTKHSESAPLTDLERITLAVIARHPEYHALLSTPNRHAERDYAPELGETNPFLHLSMHLAIEEQLSIDQPFGVRDAFQALCGKLGDEHGAQHEMMDCLAEMIWQAQRAGTGPDGSLYVACMRRKAGLI